MNHLDRNNRQPFEEIVIRSVKQLAIDPKKTPRKILSRTKPEDKIEEKYFLLKGKQKLLAQKSQIQNEILQSKALEPLINEKKLLKKLKEEQQVRSSQNSKKNLSKNSYAEADFCPSQNTAESSTLICVDKSNVVKNRIYNEDEPDREGAVSISMNCDDPAASKSKFGKEKKYLDNFIQNPKNYEVVGEEVDEDFSNNFPKSATKSLIKNTHLVTSSGSQSKLKSFFKESKSRLSNNKSKNKIASKRKQEDLTFSEEEQLKLSHKKKKIFR